MNNFQTWLETPSAIRGILVEATVSVYNTTTLLWADQTIYISNIGYLTQDSITSYLPILTGGATFTESITLDGSLSMSFGDLEISNTNGDYDTWLDSTKHIWVNKPIQVYYGDPFVQSADLATIHSTTFEKVFDGLIADVDTKSRTSLNIKVRDKLERLNTPLTENKIGTYGTWAQGQTNQDTIKQIVFGEVHNITPVLIDPSTLEYLINDGNTESLIELRDNGVPVTPGTTDLVNGKFTLAYPSSGQLTVSVQGVKNTVAVSTGTYVPGTYGNLVAKIIALIVTQYGNIDNRLALSDIDFTNFNTFNTANTQPVGYAVLDRENVLNVCNILANSVGAQIYFTRLGKLQLLQLGVYTPDTSVSIGTSDILFHTLEISNRSTVVAATKLGYCKNWTVQAGLVTDIPMAHKEMFATEWYTTTTTDTAVKATYKLNSDPVQKDTTLLKGTDASTEATRLNNYFKVPRTVYKFTGTSRLLSLKLGQQIVLTHPRFGLSAGKSGQVITLSPNWLNSTIDIEVII